MTGTAALVIEPKDLTELESIRSRAKIADLKIYTNESTMQTVIGGSLKDIVHMMEFCQQNEIAIGEPHE